MSTSTSRIAVEIAGSSASLQESAAKGAESLKGLGNVLADQTGRAKALGDQTIATNRKVAASYGEIGKGAAASMKAATAATDAGSLRLQGYQLAVQAAQTRVNHLSGALAEGSGNQQKLNEALQLAQGRLALAQGRLSAATSEVQKHSGAVKEAGYAMSGWSSQFGPLGRSLDMSARHAQLFREKGVDYLSLGVLGLTTAFIGLSAKAAVSFEEMGRKVSQQTGLTGKSLDDLMNLIRVVGRDSPYQLQQVTDAAVVLRTQFHESDAQIKSTANLMVAFANATGTDVRPQMQQLSRIMTDFRQPLSKVTDLTDKLVAVSQATQQPIGAMTNAIDKFGPKLQALGFNLNDSVRLLALFTASGIKGEQMGRGLASAITTATNAVQQGPAKLQSYAAAVQSAQLRVDTLNQKIQAGTGDQKLNAEQLAIAQQKLADAKSKYDQLNTTLGVAKKAHGDVATVIRQEMADITHAKSRQDAYALAIEYFGKNLGPSMARALYNNESALKKVDAAMGKTGTTTGLFNVDQNSLNGQLERAKNNFHDMEIAVGNKLLPALSSVVSWMRGAIHDVEDFVHHNKLLVEVLGGVATSLAAITVLSRHTPLGFLTSKLPGPVGQILSPGGGSGIFGARGALAPGSITNPIVVTMEGGRYSGLGSKSVDVAAQDAEKGAGAGVVSRVVGGFTGGIPETGGGAAGAVGGVALPAILATALPAAMVAMTVLDRKDFPTGGNQGQPAYQYTQPNAAMEGAISRQGLAGAAGLGGINQSTQSLNNLKTSLGSTQGSFESWFQELAKGGAHLREVKLDVDRAGMALDGLAHHDVGVNATIGLLQRLSGQAAKLGDTKMEFADKLGAEMLKSRGTISQGVQAMLTEVNKLPPGLRQRASDGMIAMAHELHDKGQLSQQQMDNLLTYLDTHTKGGMARVQNSVSTAMAGVFGSVSTNTKNAKTAGAKNIGDLVTSMGSSLTAGASKTNDLTGLMAGSVTTNTGHARDAGTLAFQKLAQGIGAWLVGGSVATNKGIGNIGDQVAKALSSLGAGKFSITQVAALGSNAVAAVFSGKAGGGYVGSPGEKGQDSVMAVLGRGEAVLKHQDQAIINSALATSPVTRQRGIAGLRDVFAATSGQRHWMAAGGFVGGAAQGVAQFPGYLDPIPGWTIGRTDMGVDANAPVGAAIVAPSLMKSFGVVQSNWYAGQPIMTGQLMEGPLSGRYMYWAEQITPVAPAGATIPRGGVLARYAPSGTGIEIGWAANEAGETLAQATTGYSEGGATAAGQAFLQFIQGSLGGSLQLGGGAAVVPQINMPDVKGGGVEGQMTTGALKKVVAAANSYVQAHAPAFGATGSGSAVFTGPIGTGPAYLVEVGSENDAGAGYYGIDPASVGSRGFSILSLTGRSSSSDPSSAPSAGQALTPGSVWPKGAQLYIENPASKRTVLAQPLDIGAGSDAFQPVINIYSGTQSDLGVGLPTQLLIQSGPGAPAIRPQRDAKAVGSPIHAALGGFVAMKSGGYTGGKTGTVTVKAPKPVKPPKATKPKVPKKPTHVKPPKLAKLPKLKALPGYDQTLLNEIAAAETTAQELSGWQSYIDGLHSAFPVATTITQADGTQVINWGSPQGTLGELTGLVDPTTGQQTKSIWDRLREIGPPGSSPPASITRDKMTELGVDAMILDQVQKEQYLGAGALKDFGPWLAYMTAFVAKGGQQIAWLTNAVDTTTPWGKLGHVNFADLGSYTTTSDSAALPAWVMPIIQAYGGFGKLPPYLFPILASEHPDVTDHAWGPEIRRRAHEYKDKLAQITWATKLKEKLPLEKSKRDAAIAARFAKQKHDIQIAGITSSFDTSQLLASQTQGLDAEEKALAADISTTAPAGWTGSKKAWSAERAREKAVLSAEFTDRKTSLKDALAKAKLAGRISQSNALFGLTQQEAAEKSQLTQTFGTKKNDLTDLIRNDTTIEKADKTWLSGWLSKIKTVHTTDSNDLTAATTSGGFADQLKAYNDPTGQLAISALTMQNIDIPSLLREIADLEGTNIQSSTTAADNSALLALQQQLNLQLSEALALNESQTSALASMIPEIPKYESGGPVLQDSLAMVHEGEFVVPRSGALIAGDSGGSGPPQVNVTLEIHNDGDAAALMSLIDQRIASPENVRVVSKQVGRRTSMLAGAPGGYR